MVIFVLPYTFDPSVAVALTVTVPLSTDVNSPDVAFIVAYAVPPVIDQVTVLFVALAGNTVASICKLAPSVMIDVAPPWPDTVMLATEVTCPLIVMLVLP